MVTENWNCKFYVIDPWWRRPFKKSDVYQRALFRYRVIKVPLNEKLHIEHVSFHRTYKGAKSMAALLYAISARVDGVKRRRRTSDSV